MTLLDTLWRTPHLDRDHQPRPIASPERPTGRRAIRIGHDDHAADYLRAGADLYVETVSPAEVSTLIRTLR